MSTAGLRAWAPYPGQRHDVFRTGLHGLVICRDGVPSLTHNGGARPPQAMVGRAREAVEVKRDALKPCRLTLPAVTPISGPSAQLNLFSFITPIDLNRPGGASVLKSRCGADYALFAKKIR